MPLPALSSETSQLLRYDPWWWSHRWVCKLRGPLSLRPRETCSQDARVSKCVRAWIGCNGDWGFIGCGHGSHLAFMACSAWIGHVSIGSPWQRPSSVEFQPQCDKYPPTAGCDSTYSCGTHPKWTKPLPLMRSSKPSGSKATLSGFGGGRRASRNRSPLASKPRARSWIWGIGTVATLPKDAYTTADSGCVSSHCRHGSCSFMWADASWILPLT